MSDSEIDDIDRLPAAYRAGGNGIGRLVAHADKHGLYVVTLGAERYQISDLRGHIIIKSATFAEAVQACQAFGHRHDR